MQGINRRFVIKVLGFTLSIESLFLFLSAGISFFHDENDSLPLTGAAGITLFVGILFLLSVGKDKIQIIGKRDSFLTVALSWLTFCIFGALPYYFAGDVNSVSDAFFESTSGLTTTGASIFTQIDHLSKGVLFWRCISQWLGGMGVIVFSLALLPLIGEGASQLFDAETTGITHDRFRPRVAAVAKRLWGIYIGLTGILAFLLYLGPMDLFDAVCHALSTISTGGYSTKQSSIAYWNSPYVDSVIIIFMIIGGINFSLLYFLFKGKIKKVLKNEELKWYLGIIVMATIVVSGFLIKDNLSNEGSPFSAIRESLFQVVSILSTTGFATGDYVAWGPFYWLIFLLLMTVCGCAGSTSGGMKTVRIVVLVKNIRNELSKLIHPNAVIPIRLNGTALSYELIQRTTAFVSLYIFLVFLSTLIFTLTGMGFEESLGAAFTAISNTGPGLGANGPAGSFADLSHFSKFYMSFLMIIGRLEIFTVLILFTPDFRKN